MDPPWALTGVKVPWSLKSNPEVNQKKRRFVMFFSIPRHNKRKPRGGAESCAYGCVSRRVNPL